jgi:hypothetical protein
MADIALRQGMTATEIADALDNAISDIRDPNQLITIDWGNIGTGGQQTIRAEVLLHVIAERLGSPSVHHSENFRWLRDEILMIEPEEYRAIDSAIDVNYSLSQPYNAREEYIARETGLQELHRLQPSISRSIMEMAYDYAKLRVRTNLGSDIEEARLIALAADIMVNTNSIDSIREAMSRNYDASTTSGRNAARYDLAEDAVRAVLSVEERTLPEEDIGTILNQAVPLAREVIKQRQ